MKSIHVNPKNITERFIEESSNGLGTEHVLLAQDTTELNFFWRKSSIDGLGPVGNPKNQGMFLHPSLMIDPSTESVIGLGSVDFWSRESEDDSTKDKKKTEDFEEKESFRWLATPLEAESKLPEGLKATIVGDRESDIFELFHFHFQGGFRQNTELLVRCSHNRKLDDEKKLQDAISSSKVQGYNKFFISATKKRKARDVLAEVRFGKVTIPVPSGLKSKEYQNVEIYWVDVLETKPPEGEEPIHWTLYTTWEVNSLELAGEILYWYRCRWFIEELFRILKSGYKVEEVKFDSAHALMNWCAFRLIMAVKLLHLMTQRNVEIKDSAVPYFSAYEIAVLEDQHEKLISKNSKVNIPPEKSLAWAVLIISVMGGYKVTPSSKVAGQTVLWRGLIRLADMAEAWTAALKKSG